MRLRRYFRDNIRGGVNVYMYNSKKQIRLNKRLDVIIDELIEVLDRARLKKVLILF